MSRLPLALLQLLLVALAVGPGPAAKDEHLIVLHSNDARGRFTDTSPKTGGYCSLHLQKTHQCIGGLSRTIALVRKFKQLYHGVTDTVLYFFSGNLFSGSIYFRLFKDEICTSFMNRMHPDAINLGYEEFRSDSDTLINYATSLQGVLSSNMDASGEPRLKNVSEYLLFNVSDIKVAVLGYVRNNRMVTRRMKIRFEGREKITRLTQKLRKEKGVNYFILLVSDSFEVEKWFAREVPYLDLVIGGGQDAFLWNRELDPPPEDTAIDDTYPVVVKSNAAGRKQRLIVRVLPRAMYLGVLNLTLDSSGNTKSYKGQPIYLANEFEGDNETEAFFTKYSSKVAAYSNTSFTESKVFLSGGPKKCYMQECNLGNLIADSYLYNIVTEMSAFPMWTYYAVALINSGSVVQSIDPHAENNMITRVALIEARPYSNYVCWLYMTGEEMFQMLELSTRSDTKPKYFPQVSGLRLVIDLSKPDGHKLVSVRVQSSNCLVPKYEKLVPDKLYNVVMNKYFVKYHPTLRYKIQKRRRCHDDHDDLGVIERYLLRSKTSYFPIEGRIQVIRSLKTAAARLAGSRSLLWAALLVGLACGVRRP